MRIKLKGSIIIEICREPSKKSHNIIVPDQAKSNPRRELVFTQKAIYTTYHAMGTPYRCTQKAIYTTDHAIRYTLNLTLTAHHLLNHRSVCRYITPMSLTTQQSLRQLIQVHSGSIIYTINSHSSYTKTSVRTLADINF